MANKKFSEFTSQTDSANVQFVVGYNGSDNVRISPSNLLGAYLPLAGGTMTGNTIHGDNVKSIYGSPGNDLEIYHDGGNSYIRDTGTGGLRITTDIFRVLDITNAEVMIKAEQNAAVELYYDSVKKFETTSTGVSVTTEIKAITNGTLFLDNTNNNNPYYLYNSGSNLASLQIGRGTSPGTNVAMAFDNTGNVGIGTTAPDVKLHIVKPAGGANIVTALKLDPDDTTTNSGVSIDFNASSTNTGATVVGSRIVGAREGGNASGYLSLYTSPDSSGSVPLERMRLNSSGNLGIGTTSPTAKLQVVGLAEHADNSAATTAGLTAGAFYRTGDLLKVVH